MGHDILASLGWVMMCCHVESCAVLSLLPRAFEGLALAAIWIPGLKLCIYMRQRFTQQLTTAGTLRPAMKLCKHAYRSIGMTMRR